MVRTLSLCIILFLFTSFEFRGFKSQQIKYERVESAYREYGEAVQAHLEKSKIKPSELQVLLLALKLEKVLELWGKNKSDKQYRLLKTYKFCSFSGMLGPKRRAGDYQIPEGFYHINRFNPQSNFHLSLGINYPNSSDKILSGGNDPGGDVFIHGNCVTIGCVPITDEKIKELYVYAVEARNNGQDKIPVYIFPCKMDAVALSKIKNWYPYNKQVHLFWADLQKAYTAFRQDPREVSYSINSRGRYTFF